MAGVLLLIILMVFPAFAGKHHQDYLFGINRINGLVATQIRVKSATTVIDPITLGAGLGVLEIESTILIPDASYCADPIFFRIMGILNYKPAIRKLIFFFRFPGVWLIKPA
jgi:hypothetical protein